MAYELDTRELNFQAKIKYDENFEPEVKFERSIFFSWGCTIGDCAFCYMSTQPAWKKVRETKRSLESMYAELLLARELNWDIGFVTGGIGVYTPDELEVMLSGMVEVYKQKVWLSVGPMPKFMLERFKPYIKGVVGSTETVNPELHKIICPSKPLEPYQKMFQNAIELHIPRAMTFIIGLGETKEDFLYLEMFIKKNQINKIHVYGLKPRKGTPFENNPIPSSQEQCWWISMLRVRFPRLIIQCGIWEDRLERVPELLAAGGNSLSNYRAIKLFGTKVTNDLLIQIEKSGRKFDANLLELPDVNWDELVDELNFGIIMKNKIKEKLKLYIFSMNHNSSQLENTHY